MKATLIFISSILLVIACEKASNEINCYEFDRRGCDIDEWAESVPREDSKEDQEIKMEAFLKSKDVKVKEVTLLLDVRESVCYACHCPTKDRFSVKVRGGSELEELDLLGLEEINECE